MITGKREREQKKVVRKILMIVYSNISFINGKKRLQAIRKNYRDIVISQVCKWLSNAKSTIIPNSGFNLFLYNGGFVFN